MVRCVTMIPQNMMTSWMAISAKISMVAFSISASGENRWMVLLMRTMGMRPMMAYWMAFKNSALDSSELEKTWLKKDFLEKWEFGEEESKKEGNDEVEEEEEEEEELAPLL